MSDRGEQMPPPEWNATHREFRWQATLADLLREAARNYPDHPALTGSDGTVLSHSEVERWTDRLAGLLRTRRIGRGSYVALYSARTPWAAAALLAVVKAGAAYVPVDPAWPARRVRELLDDLKVCCILAGPAQLKAAQELRWQATSVHTVVCPEIRDAETWHRLLDRGMVEGFFDFLSGEPDPLEAAGFNLRRSERPYRPADVAAYRDHVARLAREAGGDGADILEVGCGSGLIMEALAPKARRYVAADPSSVAVDRNRKTAVAGGFVIEGAVCYAHEVAGVVRGPFDLVIMASTIQFLPDMDYFLRAFGSLLSLLRPGGRILLADLIDPDAETHAGLRIPSALLESLPGVFPGVQGVEIKRRIPEEFAGELAHRYDAVVTVSGYSCGKPLGGPWAGRVLTGADIADTVVSPFPGVKPDDIAYAIFTSGSTGRPKGVLVQHRSVVNLIDWVNRTYQVGPHDRLLAVASFCFDLSVYDLFGMLAVGGSVHVASAEEIAEPESLIDLLETRPITIWDSAPAAFAMLSPFLDLRPQSGRHSLRLVLLSGDWVPLTLPAEVRGAFPAARVVALGGATECTVWSNHFPVDTVAPEWPSIPYGRPMDNARYYVLDRELRPCPVGIAGDLYIAGECVAVGYAERPGLTAEAFRPDPWASDPGRRMYRTGDRARWLEDGNLQFLGRLDDQVKIRGFRIELGEIQHALAQCPGVRAAIVVAVEVRGGKDLVAFYIPSGSASTPADVAAHLCNFLPAHMVPSRVLPVEMFPLRDTGKIDRAALLSRL